MQELSLVRLEVDLDIEEEVVKVEGVENMAPLGIKKHHLVLKRNIDATSVMKKVISGEIVPRTRTGSRMSQWQEGISKC